MKRKSLPFEEIREWARDSEIKSGTEWRSACRRGELPEGFPCNPSRVYKEWAGWHDFLGARKWPFEEQREWARNSGISCGREWKEAVRRGDIPEGIYKIPKERPEWRGWRDWLGTLIPFERARRWARASNINRSKEWKLAHKNGELPQGMSCNPNISYRREWKGWADWLQKWQPFQEARKWARNSRIRSGKEWREAKKNGVIPVCIPTAPNAVYSEWRGWHDFLGMEKPSFAQARKWARGSKISTAREWWAAAKLGQIPKNLPHKPRCTYSGEWGGWKDFLAKRKTTMALVRDGIRIWQKSLWPYGTAGKDEVGEMLMDSIGEMGYHHLNFLSLPGNGREFKKLLEGGFEFSYPDCLGVERETKKAIALKRIFRLLFARGEIPNVLPILNSDVDQLLMGATDHLLPEFNVVHLDYNGPLTCSHVLAVESVLRDNPDAVVAITVAQIDRYGWRDVDYKFGCFPFFSMSPELLFYQPYKGIAGQRMETYCFRSGSGRQNNVFFDRLGTC